MNEDELVEKSLANKFFKHIRMQSNNKRCADCGNPSPIWATTTYGFFICTACAAKHRELGVNTTKVKSTILDTWKLSELRRMYVSGNANAPKLGKISDLRIKYTGAGWYSAIVDDLSDKSTAEEPGNSFIDSITRKKDVIFEPQKIAERTMPKFSDSRCEHAEENHKLAPKQSENNNESTAKTDKPVTIRQNLFPSLQKSKGDSFNLQSKESNTRLGFGVLNLSNNSSDTSSNRNSSSTQKKT